MRMLIYYPRNTIQHKCTKIELYSLNKAFSYEDVWISNTNHPSSALLEGSESMKSYKSLFFSVTLLFFNNLAGASPLVIPYAELVFVPPFKDTFLGFGLNVPLFDWLVLNSEYGRNITVSRSEQNTLEYFVDAGFTYRTAETGSALIIKATGGVYEIDHNYSFSGLIESSHGPYSSKSSEYGSWKSGGCSLGSGFTYDSDLINITIIPSCHYLFDYGDKIVHGTINDYWLSHPYNTVFLEFPIQLGINI